MKNRHEKERVVVLTTQITHDVPILDKPCVGTVMRGNDDKLYYIISGDEYGPYGGISNFWTWCVVRADGTLGKKVYEGYGGPNGLTRRSK